MSTLTIHTGGETVTFDIGEPQIDGQYDGGDLGHYCGNLYLHIDGHEYGSLYITHNAGRPVITLGRFDEDAEEWITDNPLGAATALPAPDLTA